MRLLCTPPGILESERVSERAFPKMKFASRSRSKTKAAKDDTGPLSEQPGNVTVPIYRAEFAKYSGSVSAESGMPSSNSRSRASNPSESVLARRTNA